jgi:hypothetical protein
VMRDCLKATSRWTFLDLWRCELVS